MNENERPSDGVFNLEEVRQERIPLVGLEGNGSGQ